MTTSWHYDEEHGAALHVPWREYVMQSVPLQDIPSHASIWQNRYSKACATCIIGYCLEISLEEFLKEKYDTDKA